MSQSLFNALNMYLGRIMMKKFLVLLLAALMVFSFAACGGGGGEEEAAGGDDAMKVAMVTDYGDITDQSFNQTTYEACKAFC
jgi:basic membrane protein A